ncbi:MAG: phenylacetate--CoA ligase family protein, partial [Acidobacteriota bacterium]
MTSLAERLGPLIYARAPAGVQNLLLSHRGARLKTRRFGTAYTRWMELLSRSEHWSQAERDEYTYVQIRRIVKRAYLHVPYYRRIMTERKLHYDDIKGSSDLARLPVLTKDDIRQYGDQMVADDIQRRELLLGQTSGTTGSPLEFWWDQKVEIATNAMLWRHRGFAGFSFGQSYATLLGRIIVPLQRTRPPFWRLNRPWKQLFLSSFHLKEENLDAYLEAMAGHGTAFLEAYPSNAYLLARHLESRGRHFPLKAVFTSSETLLPVQREIIENRFGCRIFDYYGQAERVMFSGECEMHDGHHQFVEYGALEVLDEEGEPVGPGREG